ncbi:MAG: HIT family protein [Pigmentiphaga sp.]
MQDCPLCQFAGPVLWEDGDLRVIAVADDDYPGFTRVIWKAHIAEMSDLSATERARLMLVVNEVENVQRQFLRPDKINLASFGNQVPHVHWHVIPRWRDDKHFPDSYWSAARREPDEAWLQARQDRLPAYHEALRTALDTEKY